MPVWTGILSVKKRLNQTVVTGFPIADVLTPRKPGAYSVKIERIKSATEKARNRYEYEDRSNISAGSSIPT